MAKRFNDLGYLPKNKDFRKAIQKKGFTVRILHDNLKLKSASAYKDLNLPVSTKSLQS